VARRPEVASREINPAAAGVRRFFPLSNESIFLFSFSFSTGEPTQLVDVGAAYFETI